MLIEKRSEMKMDREEIYEMVIREMTETAVRERNEQSPEEQELQDKVARLDHDCLYLYVQGAKDCVELLKKLGVL